MQKNRYIAVWLRMLAEAEIRAARGSIGILKKQGKLIQSAFVDGGQTAVEQVIQEGQNDWAKYLVAIYAGVIKTFAAFINEQLGLNPKKASFLDIVQGFVARNAYKKSKYITDSSHLIVKRVVGNGIANGLGENQIAGDLLNEFNGAVGASRARTIARTEVHDAATYGMQAAAEETERPMMREWVAVIDESTRQDHADADGQLRGMDELFDVGGELLDRPGDGSAANSINCRCTIAYIPQSADVSGDNSGEIL